MRIISAIACFIFYLQAQAQILPSYGDSRTATTGWQFLKITPDARSAAMSESFIAVVNDVSSLYWNAAGLTRLDTNSYHFTIDYTNYTAATNLSYAGFAYRLGDNTVVGASLQYFDTGNMNVTTEFLPTGTGQTFRATDFGLGISLARELTDQFSFGITAKYIREDNASVHNQNLIFDFAFQYNIGIAHTRFAVGFNNFGFNSKPSGEIQAENLYGTFLITDFKQVSVPSVFRLGFAWDVIQNKIHTLTIAAQLNHPTDNNETYCMGIEYSWKQLFFARTGYLFATDETAFPSFGFGMQFKRYFGIVNIDYGFAYQNKLGIQNRIGLGLTI